ncbi:MAG: DUF3592 domain-containing protein [Verrucomicrobia bacterium]|nr:DUF3592 domain-containing protein [Verrucomicrobiota bacterium]
MAISVHSSAKTLGSGGKVIGTLFFSVFLTMGLFFEVMVVKHTVKNLATFGWNQTQATILASEITPPKDDESDPTLHVRYTYIAGGSQFEAQQYARDALAHETRDAYQLVERFQPGVQVPCWFNPQNHSESVLARKSPLQALLVLFPLIFVVIGGGGIWALWFWRGKKSNPENNAPQQPISNRPPATGTSRLAMGIFFSIFLLVGVGVGYGFFVRPVIKIVAARNWPTVSCEILSSRVKTHSSDDGSTYSVDVVYRYTYQNRTYTANRYHFFTGSSSGYDGKAKAVRRFPAGGHASCFVNPADPTEAVLERGFTTMLWFGFIPLIFAVVGFFGVLHAIKGKTNPHLPPKHAFNTSVRSGGADPTFTNTDTAGPGTLQPSASPKVKLFGLAFAAVFWNGIVSVFLFNVSWSGMGLFMGLFLLPFIAVGLGLIGGVFYQAMALFNPRPRLTVSRTIARPGDTIELSWAIEGRIDRLQRLQISLEGREEATYRRGTDNVTDKEVFARIPLLDTVDPIAMHSGSAKLQIPPDAMHSFKSANNKIVWALMLHGEIPRWPDIKDEYPYGIAPKPLAK